MLYHKGQGTPVGGANNAAVPLPNQNGTPPRREDLDGARRNLGQDFANERDQRELRQAANQDPPRIVLMLPGRTINSDSNGSTTDSIELTRQWLLRQAANQNPPSIGLLMNRDNNLRGGDSTGTRTARGQPTPTLNSRSPAAKGKSPRSR